jgi:hypothetical protein
MDFTETLNPRFAANIAGLHAMFEALLACPAFSPAKLPPDFQGAGVYLFSEAGRHLYVGRSDNLRRRIQTHIRPSAGTNQAAFAYRLARESAGIYKVSYKPLPPESDWSQVEPFVSAFPASKERIRKMDLRFVREQDSVSQMLLEAYVAIALNTPYNDFANH